MLTLRKAIAVCGGPERSARICDISSRAVYKWLLSGRLPRTEYTGETQYAVKLAAASAGGFTAEQLLEACRLQQDPPAA